MSTVTIALLTSIVLMLLCFVIGAQLRRRDKVPRAFDTRPFDERFQTTLDPIGDQISDMVAVLDATYSFRYINTSYCVALGAVREAILGSSIENYVSPDEAERIRCALRSLSAEHRSTTMMIDMRGVNGRILHVATKILYLTDQTTPKIGPQKFAIISKEITNKCEYGTPSETYLDEIAPFGAVDLGLQRLAKIGALSAGIAHEINQPLATIRFAVENASDTLEETPVNLAGVKQKLAIINRQIDRLAGLTKHMRQFARGEPTVCVATDVNNVVQNTKTLVDGRLRQSGVTLISSIPETTPLVKSDTLLLEQVLVTLIVNACEAYDRNTAKKKLGSSERWIRLSAHENDNTIILSISDQAGGIPNAQRDKLFAATPPAECNPKTAMLDLWVCHSIMDALGGKISLTSSPESSQFHLSLPLATPSSIGRTTVVAGKQEGM